MPEPIIFPEAEPTYVFERDCLSFRALADEKPVECLVSVELLMARFDARDFSEEEMRRAYREHKTEIQAIAREQIRNGWIDEERRVFLTTRFTRLTVTYGEQLGQWATGRTLVDKAHRMLLEIIGPRAGEVSVDWNGEEGPGDQSVILLKLVDHPTLHTVVARYNRKAWEDPNSLRVSLAGAWNSILRARSRNLSLQSG